MQSKCHQKGKNNQVCGSPSPQLLSSFFSVGDVRVGGDTGGEVQISQAVAATTVSTVHATGVAGPGSSIFFFWGAVFLIQTSGDLLAWSETAS